MATLQTTENNERKILSLNATLIILKLGNKAVVQSLTWLYDPGLGPQIGQVHIGFPAIYYGVGVLAGPVGRAPVSHGHLKETAHLSADLMGGHKDKGVTYKSWTIWFSRPS